MNGSPPIRVWTATLLGFVLLGGLLAGCGNANDSTNTASAPTSSTPEPVPAQQPVLTPQQKSEAKAKAKAAAKAEAARIKKQEEVAAQRRAKKAERQRERVKRMEAKEQATGGWTGVDGSNYEIAKETCGAFSMQQLATEYGLPSSADEFEIAENNSHEFVGRFQQANFEGCLAGMGIE